MEKEQIKRSILATLMKLSTVDNKITEKEFLFIKEISGRIGIQESELDGIINEHEKLSLRIPTDEQERMTILYYLLQTPPNALYLTTIVWNYLIHTHIHVYLTLLFLQIFDSKNV